MTSLTARKRGNRIITSGTSEVQRTTGMKRSSKSRKVQGYRKVKYMVVGLMFFALCLATMGPGGSSNINRDDIIATSGIRNIINRQISSFLHERPPECTRAQLLKQRDLLMPSMISIKRPYFQSAFITQKTKCPDSSNWLEEYYKELQEEHVKHM